MVNLKTVFTKLRERTKEDPESLIADALGLGFVGDYEEAIKKFDRILYLLFDFEDKSQKSYLLTMKAFAHDELGQTDEALDSLKKAIQIDSENILAYLLKGMIHHDNDNFDKALDCFKKGIVKAEGEEKNLFNLEISDIYGHLEKYNDALKFCDEVLSTEPNNIEGLFGKSSILSEIGRNELALEYVNKALKIDPEDIELIIQKGTILLDCNEYENALKHFEKAIQIDPTEELAWYNKACVLSRMNKQEDAIDALIVATSIEPDNINSLQDEKDFSNIRNLERFKKIVAKHV